MRRVFLVTAIVLIAACAAHASPGGLTVVAPFAGGRTMERKFTCDGADVSPALQWTGVPTKTKSLVVIASDPDAPGGTFYHWVLYGLPPAVTRLGENVPKTSRLPDGARQGTNDFGRVGYGGPCPPKGPPHHYYFRVYALDSRLDLAPGMRASEVLSRISGHVLARGEAVGIFSR